MTQDEKRRVGSRLDWIERHMKRVGELKAEVAAAVGDTTLALARGFGGATALAELALDEVGWLRADLERGE